MTSRWPEVVSLVVLAAAACGPSSRGDDDASGDADSDSDSDGDADAGDVDSGIPDGDLAGQVFVYAHTATELYQVDPDTLAIELIGTIAFSGNGRGPLTDIAIDRTGQMIGVSFTTVYRINPSTAAATELSGGLTGNFNGLSFVPAAQLGMQGDDVLVGTRLADGLVFRIDPTTGESTQIGDMGPGFTSSGDLVSVAGLGTLQTADNGIGSDRLVQLAGGTFAATPIGTEIGFGEIWGVAYWKDKVFGFTESGEFITIDPTTGVGTLVQGGGPAWYGAAVTTLAPVVQ